jgi:hypothetical protein
MVNLIFRYLLKKEFMKSDVIVSLIKEIVKNEVKQQVKEEIIKLVKSGAVTLNSQKKSKLSLAELTEVNTTASTKKQTIVPTQQKPQIKKEFSKDPMINEILNMTKPFSASERVEGGMMNEGSILDSIQPQRYQEDEWDTMDYRNQSVQESIPSTGNAGLDALNKALTRDYSSLTKVFAKQEKEKGLR